MATPLFFASATSPLYGVFHAAPGARKAVLILNSLGYEYMRSHRALKTLAQQLAKQNVCALRFDYRGTGHSACALNEMSLTDWIEDGKAAITELVELSGGADIQLIGLRFGALLALLLSENDPRVKGVALWDPVESGEELFSEMDRAEASLEREKDPYLTSFAQKPSTLEKEGRLGYCFSEEMEQDVRKLEISSLLTRISDVTIFAGGEAETPASILLSGVNVVRVAAPDNWCEIDNFGSVLLPQEMIRTIVQRVSGDA